MATNSLMKSVRSDVAGYGVKFVQAWQKAPTLEAFMASGVAGNATAMDASAVAAYLRKLGVELKKMPRIRGKVAVDKAAVASVLNAALTNPGLPSNPPAGKKSK